MGSIALVIDDSHGGEYRIFCDCGKLAIDDLGLFNWYFCPQGCYVYPGQEEKFIAEATSYGIEVVVAKKIK